MTIVSTIECQEHLNLPSGQDDSFIESKIEAAEGWIANHLGVALIDLAVIEIVDEGTPEESTVYHYPALLKEAIRQLVAHWYENREAQTVPAGLADLLAPYREWAF